MGITIFRKGIIAAGIILFSVYLFFACTKTTTTVPIVTTSSTIAAIIKNGTNLTILDSILKKTGYILTLDSAGPFTLFASTDVAFAAAGFTDSTIYKDSINYLKRLVLYNLIYGDGFTLSQLPQGIDTPFQTAGGEFIYVTTDSAGVFINGSLIAQSNVLAKNGYIQSVQNVLFPPYGSVLQTLQGLSLVDTTLTVLVSALNYASTGMGSASLDSLLASNGSVSTIFAPTNNAFRAFFGDTTTVSFANYTADSLIRLLNRHILNGRFFTSDFSFGTSIPTLLTGDSVNFSPFYPNVIVQKDSITTANIITPNILSTNGVIHKIDQVLIP
jgi:uncharacterized surface protein with fasciclin (FAS1) repeats